MVDRLNVLVLGSEVPYPPTNGGARLRLFYLLKYLSPLHDLTLLTLFETPEERELLEPLQQYCSRVRCFDGTAPTTPPTLRERLQVPSQRWTYRTDMADAISQELQSGRYDLVHANGGTMAVYTPLLHGRRKVIAATDSLTLASHNQIGIARGLKATLQAHYRHALFRRFERRSYRQYDACVVVADRDADTIRRLCPNLPVHIIPNGITPDFLTAATYPDGDEFRLIFTGTMDFEPNVDAVIWFAEQVLPRITARFPATRFQIAGRSPTQEVQNLARRDSSISVTGFVPDLRPHLAAATVFVCPMRYGSGLKNKLLEAMAMGMAVVTTTEGASGNAGSHNRHFLVADDPQTFADSVIALLIDAEKRKRLGQEARTLVAEHYTWQRAATLFSDLYGQVVRAEGRTSS